MDWQEILIEMPARFIGDVTGALFHLAWVLAVFAAAIALGRLVYLKISIRYLNWAAAIVLGLYVFLVLARAESFFAAGVFHAMEQSSEDDY